MVNHNGYSLADWIKKYKFTIKVPDGLHGLKIVKNFKNDIVKGVDEDQTLMFK